MTSPRPPIERQTRGGRGARERILAAAARLFYEQGINATGMEELTEVAQVSKRTLYKHFAGKDELVGAYLRRFQDQGRLPGERALDRADLASRDRLLAVFEKRGRGSRGCPYVNAAVEIADAEHPNRRLVAAHKRAFVDRLTETARAAGAREPRALARQLAVLFDGVAAQRTVLGDDTSVGYARAAAAHLIALAIDTKDDD
jgi:AcrR family transcriptional regulator